MIEHDGCVGCKYEHEDEASPHCDKCTQNSTDKYTPASNADRIRCMSDEELAKIIVSESVSEKIPFCQNKPECSKMLDDDEMIPESHCIKCALDWLRQPSETEGKE